MRKLEAAISLAKDIRDLSLLDCDVMIADAEGTILHFVQANTFKGNQTIGEKASGGLVASVLETRTLQKKVIPESVYGVKLKAVVAPIFEDDGTLAGVIGIASNMATQDTLHQASQSIAATSEEITATTEELVGSASALAESLVEVREKLENITSEISKTEDILKFVNEVADNSNLLGLNAAIEAARAGEQGQGFSVVADKIRQMAENSSDSVNDIRKIIKTIQKETSQLMEMINKASDQGQQQAAATEEIESAMQQLSTAANEIESVAEII